MHAVVSSAPCNRAYKQDDPKQPGEETTLRLYLQMPSHDAMVNSNIDASSDARMARRIPILEVVAGTRVDGRVQEEGSTLRIS